MKVFYFSAPWCVACKENKPMVTATCLANDVGYEEVDVDQQIEKANMSGVSSVPTFLLMGNKREELARHIGAISKQRMLELFHSGGT